MQELPDEVLWPILCRRSIRWWQWFLLTLKYGPGQLGPLCAAVVEVRAFLRLRLPRRLRAGRKGAEAGFLWLRSSPSSCWSCSWVWGIERCALKISTFANCKGMRKYREICKYRGLPQNTLLCGARGLWLSNIQRETLEERPTASRGTFHLQMIVIMKPQKSVSWVAVNGSVFLTLLLF